MIGVEVLMYVTALYNLLRGGYVGCACDAVWLLGITAGMVEQAVVGGEAT